MNSVNRKKYLNQARAKRTRVYIFIFIFNVLAPIQAVFADQESQAQEKLQKVAAEIREIEQNIAKNTHNQDKLRAGMRKLDTQIGGLHKDIRRSNQNMQSVRERSQQLEAKDKQLRGELIKQGDAFKQQARMAYMTQHQSKWKLILTQSSLQDVGRMAVMYDYVNQARLEQIQHLNNVAEQLQQNQAQLNIEQTRLQQLVQQLTEQQAVLQQARGQKEQAQSALAQLLDQDQTRLKQAQKNQKAIKKLLRKLQRKSAVAGTGKFASQKGRLHWPVKGKLLNRYGAAKDSNSKITWDGVSIKAPRGREVLAVYSGTVVFSDWLQGYGWLLIIDHGDGFMSLYAHAEGLHKDVGDGVKKGELIAVVGDSGGAVQPSLYFEIRRQGAPVDPADWCTVPKLAYSS